MGATRGDEDDQVVISNHPTAGCSGGGQTLVRKELPAVCGGTMRERLFYCSAFPCVVLETPSTTAIQHSFRFLYSLYTIFVWFVLLSFVPAVRSF